MLREDGLQPFTSEDRILLAILDELRGLRADNAASKPPAQDLELREPEPTNTHMGVAELMAQNKRIATEAKQADTGQVPHSRRRR